MESKSNTKKMTLIGLMLVLIAMIISVSFAYFTVNTEVGDIFSTSGKAKNETPVIDFTENKSGVSLSGTYPMTDDIAVSSLDAYTYTVTNKESEDLMIDVVLEITATSTLDDSLVNFSLDGSIRTLGGLTEMTPSTADYRNTYVIDNYTLTSGESKTSSLQIWINEDATVENAQNKTWSSKLMVIPSFDATN